MLFKCTVSRIRKVLFDKMLRPNLKGHHENQPLSFIAECNPKWFLKLTNPLITVNQPHCSIRTDFIPTVPYFGVFEIHHNRSQTLIFSYHISTTKQNLLVLDMNGKHVTKLNDFCVFWFYKEHWRDYNIQKIHQLKYPANIRMKPVIFKFL